MTFISDLRKLDWSTWLQMLISAAISAAAGAAVTVVTANPVALALGAPAFTPRQLGIVVAYSAILAVAFKLKQSPLPSRREAIALVSGVHSSKDVDKIVAATAPESVPTKEVAAAILASQAPPADKI